MSRRRRPAGPSRRSVRGRHLVVPLGCLLLGATGAASTSGLAVPATSVDRVVVPAAPPPASPAEGGGGAP